jgi:beta-glucosidase
MNLRRLALLCFALTLVSLSSFAQVVPPQTANEARVDRLLSQMTLEEKMNLIRGDVELREC